MAARKTAPATQEIYQCVEQAWVELKDGTTMKTQQGRNYAAGEPVVKQYPHFFKPVGETVRPYVEQATAKPGELRGTQPEDARYGQLGNEPKDAEKVTEEQIREAAAESGTQEEAKPSPGGLTTASLRGE